MNGKPGPGESQSVVRSWWRQRQARERQLLTLAAITIALLLIWTLVWEPLAESRQRLESQASYRSQTLEQLQQLHQQVLPLRGAQASPLRDDSTSLLRLSDSTVRAAGLAGALRRIEPDDNQHVRLWLEGASFDVTIAWLQQLAAEHGVTVSDVNIERAGSPGVVNARLTLADQAL